MTALEKASHAVEDAMTSDNNHPDDIARAVLLAIREPDDRIRYDGDRALVNALAKPLSVTDAALSVHTAMIDAILDGK